MDQNHASQTPEDQEKESESRSKQEEMLNNIICNETIYEVFEHKPNQHALNSPPSHVVSERVQNLASQIYTELQKIISRCSDDEEVVGGLMPLIVNVLESLDLAIIESQQLQVELELCKDDNEQLVSAFDKEKGFKKKLDQKLLELEFHFEEEKQQFGQKINSLENIVKMLELKAKNASDHASRLEEKEAELKLENGKLHNRYNELLKSQCDLMERVKILVGNDESLNILAPQNLNSKSLSNKKFESQGFLGFCEEPEAERAKATSVIQRQAWVDAELSLEDTSIIEDVDDMPRDKEPSSLTVTDNFFGMEKEVQNLIRENDELLATKNALNIVKDDLIAKVDELQSDLTMAKDENRQLSVVKDKLKFRISQMEDEMKKIKEELDEAKRKIALQIEDEEEGVPMTQRKRFTRIEMARVLMERNQFKEKWMELQEAIKWSDIMKNNKNEAEGKRSPIWKFFSNLFSSSATTGISRETNRNMSKNTAIRYSAANSGSITPALDAMRRRALSQNSSKLVLLMDSDISSERARSLKAIRAHVNRTNGDRIQAYGWSIAGFMNPFNSNEALDSTFVGTNSGLKKLSVPVPTYCRPFNNDDLGMKIWCAAAVDLTGGEIEVSSLSPVKSEIKLNKQEFMDNKDKKLTSDAAILDLETELGQTIRDQSEFPDQKKLSTFVWICSVSHSKSKVTIVNIRNNPSEILDSFLIKTHLLCIASVPGAKFNDMQGFDGVDVRRVKIIQIKDSDMPKLTEKINQEQRDECYEASENKNELATEEAVKSEQLEKLNEFMAYTEPPSPTIEGEINFSNVSVYQAMSTCLPTMWLGGQNGLLYVHSGVAQWSHCIFSIKLPDYILQIIHFRGRVFVALVNGQCCVFTRSPLTGEWDFSQYLLIDMSLPISVDNSPKATLTNTPSVGSPNSTASYSIRCIEVTKSAVWLGYRNSVYILNPKLLKIVHTFAVHPRKESQVRQLAAIGDGVWCSLRLYSTIRLYSSLKPYQHLQDIDIEPFVTKMLTPKAFSLIRITALKAGSNRLWIGTANGVILSIPCDKNSNHLDSDQPQLVSDTDTGNIALSTFIPRCNPSFAQLSYHGHKDAVKFFVCAKNQIMSGGEGYIDFRLSPEDDTHSLSKGDRSHVIVWEIPS